MDAGLREVDLGVGLLEEDVESDPVPTASEPVDVDLQGFDQFVAGHPRGEE